MITCETFQMLDVPDFVRTLRIRSSHTSLEHKSYLLLESGSQMELLQVPLRRSDTLVVRWTSLRHLILTDLTTSYSGYTCSNPHVRLPKSLESLTIIMPSLHVVLNDTLQGLKNLSVEGRTIQCALLPISLITLVVNQRSFKSITLDFRHLTNLQIIACTFHCQFLHIPLGVRIAHLDTYGEFVRRTAYRIKCNCCQNIVFNTIDPTYYCYECEEEYFGPFETFVPDREAQEELAVLYPKVML